MKKIAIIETSYVGDLAFLLPFFKAIKRIFPDSETTLVTTPAPAQLAEIFPHLVDEILIFDKREKKISSYLNIRERLKGKKFDILFAPHRFSSTKIVSKFIDSKLKISYMTPLCKKFFDLCVPFRTDLKVEERPQELLKAIGENMTEDDYEKIMPPQDLLLKIREEHSNYFLTPFIFIIPGSEWTTKRWPSGYYSILSQWICEKGFRVFIGGSPREQNLLTEIEIKSNNCAQKIDMKLKEMLLFMSYAEIIIGGDTGPIHLMRIMGKKVITIFGPTPHDIFRWHEYQIPIFSRGLQCRPCSSHGPVHCPRGDLQCQFSITPENVWVKFIWMLKKFYS